MGLFTYNATSNTTPDPAQGGSAVSSPTNTGYGSTTTDTTGSGTVKSILWTAFPASGGQALSKKLIFGWDEDGVFGGAGSNDFRVQISVDGGSNFTDVFNHTAINAFASNLAETVTLNVTQDLTLVRLRARQRSTSGASTLTTDISDVRIEVTTVDASVVVFM